MRWTKICIAVLAMCAFVPLLLGLVGCANMASPEGGPYDMSPPRLLRATPPHGSLHVSGQKIKLLFDENVNVEKQQEKVLVSPPQLQQPKISANGRVISIELQDSLLPHTTYVIDFRDAIVDHNEANPIDGFVYAFSTGAKMDSMQMSGMVLHARTLEPMRGILAGAYLAGADGVDNFRQRPFRAAALTGVDGRFHFRHVADTSYRVFALKDMDNSYSYTLPSEGIAFVDSVYRTERLLVAPPMVGVDSMAGMSTDSLVQVSADSATRTGLPLHPVEQGGQVTPPTVGADSMTIGANADSLQVVASWRYKPDDILLRYFVATSLKQFVRKTSRLDSATLTIEFALPLQTLPRLTLLQPSGEILGSSLLPTIHLDSLPLEVDTSARILVRDSVTKGAASLGSSLGSDGQFGLSEEVVVQPERTHPMGTEKRSQLRFEQTMWYLATVTAPREVTYFLTHQDLLRADSLKTEIAYDALDSLSRPIVVRDTISWLHPQVDPLSRPVSSQGKSIVATPTSEPSSSLSAVPLYRVRVSSSQGIVASTPRDTIFITLGQPTTDMLRRVLHLEQAADTLWVAVPDYHLERMAHNPLCYALTAPWAYGHTYRVRIDSAALHSIYGAQSHGLEYSLSIGKEEEFGSLDLRLEDASSAAVVELLDDKDKVLVALSPRDGRVQVSNLKPATYYVRLFEDANGNGLWDTGEYPHRQPEQVYYCPLPLGVKAKFTTGETWRVNATPLWEQRPEALREKVAELQQANKQRDLNEEYERRMQERQKKRTKKK